MLHIIYSAEYMSACPCQWWHQKYIGREGQGMAKGEKWARFAPHIRFLKGKQYISHEWFDPKGKGAEALPPAPVLRMHSAVS